MMADAPPLKLWNNKKEQEKYENLADLYAIVKTTEKLERAYVRDVISAKDYEPLCEKLIAQFRTLWETLRTEVPDVQAFMAEYNMQCPMAAKRLIYSGLPATVEHGKPNTYQANSAVAVAQTVSDFITVMDSLKLGMKAVDEIFPLLRDLMNHLNLVTQLPANFSAKEKTKKWYTDLHTKPASYTISAEEERQMTYDMESSYNEFMSWLQEKRPG